MEAGVGVEVEQAMGGDPDDTAAEDEAAADATADGAILIPLLTARLAEK